MSTQIIRKPQENNAIPRRKNAKKVFLKGTLKKSEDLNACHCKIIREVDSKLPTILIKTFSISWTLSISEHHSFIIPSLYCTKRHRQQLRVKCEYRFLLLLLIHHDNQLGLLFPNHLPEIFRGLVQGMLGSDVTRLAFVILLKKKAWSH